MSGWSLALAWITVSPHLFNLLAFANEFSFCSEGKLYVFSSEACPGGVLLKKPLRIDEPCHCFGSDLRIYSRCDAHSLMKQQVTESGCEQPLIENPKEWNGQATLLIPAELSLISPKKKETCEIPRSCIPSDKRRALEKPRKLERKLLEGTSRQNSNESRTLVVTHPQETSASSSLSESEEGGSSYSQEILSQIVGKESLETTTTGKDVGLGLAISGTSGNQLFRAFKNEISQGLEEIGAGNSLNVPRFTRDAMDKTMAENKELMRHVWNVKSGLIPDPPPNTQTFKMIKKAMRIVSKMVPNKIIADVNFYEAYLAFRQLFSHIDEDELTDKYLTIQGYHSVILSLDLCLNNARELAFKTTGRPRQIQQFYQMSEGGFTVKEPKIPDDRAHSIDGEDYIVGIIWKIFDIVLSSCIEEFKENPGSQFDYVNSILNVFHRESVQNRWYQVQVAIPESETKVEIISHPDIKILMENLDKIDAAAHLASTFQAFLSKPKHILIHDLVTLSSKLDPSEIEANTRSQVSIETDDINSKEKREISPTKVPQLTVSSLRAKREVSQDENLDLSTYEIWDGTAFCLQRHDHTLPPSFVNTFPQAKTICQGIEGTL